MLNLAQIFNHTRRLFDSSFEQQAQVFILGYDEVLLCNTRRIKRESNEDRREVVYSCSITMYYQQLAVYQPFKCTHPHAAAHPHAE